MSNHTDMPDPLPDDLQEARVEDMENRCLPARVVASVPAVQDKPPVTAAQAKIEAVAQLTAAAYQRASMLQLTAEERAALQAPFPDTDFQQGAGGKENLIYIQHSALRERFNSVIGMGQWAIIPRNRWGEDFRTSTGKEATRFYVEAMLLIRGCFVGEAVGDMVYYKNNDSQNYGDGVEGAKTAAFRRCAKELGVGLQAWDKAWCEGWWARKRGTSPKATPAPAPKPTPAPAPVAKPPEKHTLASLMEASKAKVLATLGSTHKADLWEYALGQAWILDNEGIEDIPAHRMFPNVTQTMTYEQAQAMIAQDYAVLYGAVAGTEPPQKEEFSIKPNPAKVIPEDGQTAEGALDKVSCKTGTSAKGEWKRYGLLIGDVWFNTFSATEGEKAEQLKGKQVKIWFKQGERGNDLLKIEPA